MPCGQSTAGPHWDPEGRPRGRCPSGVSAALALGLSGMRSCLALRRLLKLKWSLAHTWTGLREGRETMAQRGCQVPRHATKESEMEFEPRIGTLQSPCSSVARRWAVSHFANVNMKAYSVATG